MPGGTARTSQPPGYGMTAREPQNPVKRLTIGLNAAIVSVIGNEPQILTVPHEGLKGGEEEAGGDTLPFGPFDPLSHRTLDQGLRGWVQEQTRLQLGYVE